MQPSDQKLLQMLNKYATVNTAFVSFFSPSEPLNTPSECYIEIQILRICENVLLGSAT